MASPSIAGRVAGSGLVRSLVNRGFHAYSGGLLRDLDRQDPAELQRRQLRGLLHKARRTRFGRDHRFDAVQSVEDFQKAVPLRTYEQLWNEYLRDQYPVFRDLTWPGLVPYLALTSGTTQGATKYIPVSREMIASNQAGAKLMVAAYLKARPQSRLFRGRMFFLGGSTALEEPAPGVRQGDLSAIAALEVSDWLRPYTFPPVDLALEPDWHRKLSLLAESSLREPITLVGGVPSWMLLLFDRIRELSGKATLKEAWPSLELAVHGGVKFDPYRESFRRAIGDDSVRLQETYPCSEGFIAFGDPATGLLRPVLHHGLFYEFVPVGELGSNQPVRHWLGTVQTGINYAIVVSTCAGMWSHIIGDTVRFESLDPPLLSFTGRTKYTLSAFGEHLISEEVEAAIASASAACGGPVRDWHVGPVFRGSLGHHQYVIEFLEPPSDLEAFRQRLDADLCERNADYQAHRAEGVGMPMPAVVVARPGGFDSWMKARGKFGGQNKVPRMDNTGEITAHLVAHLRGEDAVAEELGA